MNATRPLCDSAVTPINAINSFLIIRYWPKIFFFKTNNYTSNILTRYLIYFNKYLLF